MLGRENVFLAKLRFGGALKEALALDPIALVPNLYLAEAYIRTGQYETALHLIDQTLEMHPHAPITSTR